MPLGESMPIPTKVHLRRSSNQLELHFSEEVFSLPAEYLRVYSPSAEVRGHGKGQEQLQFGKMKVAITHMEAQGNYAIKIHFDDGHNTGIYTWDYLYQLGSRYDDYWQDYLRRLHHAGKPRDPDESVVRFSP